MHTIIHIGAGQAKELSQWLNTGAKHVILVEPNPRLAENLRQKTAGMDQVVVLETAVTTTAANNQLHEYNLPEASSLHSATGLKTLFPGLKTNAIHTVATLSPKKLLIDYAPKPDQLAMLVLQAPGEEHAILKALVNTGQLEQFSELRLAVSLDSYYKGSIAAEQTRQLLANYGYDIIEENQQDPDWPTWHLQRNPLKDQISAFQAELIATKQAQAQAERDNLDLQRSLEDLQTNSRTEIIQLKKQAFTELEEAKQTLQKSEVELLHTLESNKHQMAEKDQRVGELEKLETDLSQQLDQSKRQLTNKQTRIKDLETQVGDLTHKTDELRKTNQLMQQDLVKAETQLQLLKEFVLHE